MRDERRERKGAERTLEDGGDMRVWRWSTEGEEGVVRRGGGLRSDEWGDGDRDGG